MANWYGAARSNYFSVKDNKKFSSFINQLQGMRAEQDKRSNTWWIYSDDCDDGGLDWTVYDEDGYPDDSVDAMNEFASHLQDGEVAIFFECGAESMAIAWTGEIDTVNLYDIYDLVAKKYKIKPKLVEW